MPKESKLKKEFLAELEKNILLNNKNRHFLLSRIDSLPDQVLTTLLKELKKQNRMADKFLKIAIDNDPDIVEDMKTKAKQFKNKVTKLKESEEIKDVETTLEEELKQI